jgi:hypothetical protein
MIFSGRIKGEALIAIEQSQAHAPVKVVNLAHALGLKAYVEDLPSGVSGKLYRDSDAPAGWSISVNGGEAKVRRRFTTAHEIGHYLLHRDSVKDSVEDDIFYRSGLSSKQETEANSFAADLLMPWSLIQSLTEKGLKTAEELADALQVSQVAMNIRLGLPT